MRHAAPVRAARTRTNASGRSSTRPTSCATTPHEIAWQTRAAVLPRRHADAGRQGAAVAGRRRPAGDGLRAGPEDLFARICSFFERIELSTSSTPRSTRRGTATRSTPSWSRTRTRRPHYRDIISLIEHELARSSAARRRCPAAARAGFAPVAHFPITPTVDMRPDERGKFRCSRSWRRPHRPAVSIASVLARYNINLHTAKIMTLGERVEDVFLVAGESLSNQRVVLTVLLH